MSIDTITVFCGSSPGARSAYAEAARELGRGLARSGVRLVYGGASVGTMGVLADAALEAGGHVTGILPRALETREVAHTGLSRLMIVDDMLDRKREMARLADAYIVLPGGLGTFDELFEVMTATQLGLDPKRCGLVNIEDYFTPLLEAIAKVESEGFARNVDDLVTVETSVGRLLEQLLD
ncbi:MAG: TIGR00730 family Rossman fold protein [Acidobacteriota bacterium]